MSPILRVPVDRLEEVLYKSEPQWQLRAVVDVLVEDLYSDGYCPKYEDLRTVGQLMKAGPDKLSLRFREVDPEIWKWLFEELDEAWRRTASAQTAST